MKVLFPLPDRDFDTTEVAVPWSGLNQAGHEIVFATEGGGRAPTCDPRLLTGVLFGRLGAASEAKTLYCRMTRAPEFRAPIAWSEIEPADFDGLVLAGGHAPGMRQYLGSPTLREKVASYWALSRPVGAICHGVLVLARTRRTDGRSLISDRATTCLPRYMERGAFWLTAWRLGHYYRTYPSYVEDEVRAALSDPSLFVRGPRVLLRRGTATDDRAAFTVRDDNYLSARWPGDAYLFTSRFLEMLTGA